MPVYHESVVYRDRKGLTSWVRLYVSAATQDGAATLVATQWVSKFTNVSAGAIQRWSGVYETPLVPATYGVAAQYPDAEDRVVFNVLTVAGTIHKVMIPCPFDGIWLADKETLNLSNGRITAMNDVFSVRGMCDRDGNLFTGLQSGFRIRVPMHRKVGLYVKNPQLTTPAG